LEDVAELQKVALDEMSNYTRSLPSHLRNPSLGGSHQQSPVMLARIAEKRAELANLKDLQALSGGLADQMQMLADKLQTLSDGTEGMYAKSSLLGSVARNTPLPRGCRMLPKMREKI